ncbi:MAG: hypothetical protein ACRDHP_01030 [Ktedonobacterales bacterium]
MATEDVGYMPRESENAATTAPADSALAHSAALRRTRRRSASVETAIRVGLNTGLALAGLNAVNWLVGSYAGGAFTDGQAGDTFAQPICGVAFLAACALFLGRLALLFRAGYLARQHTGLVSRGALAGLLAGVVDGGSGVVVTLLGVVFFPVYTLTSGYTSAAQPVGSALLVALAETGALALVGVLLGGMGGASVEGERPAGAA